jgi:hypothetical protein
MRAGKVVFDGKASELTQAAAREIYGDDGLKEAFSEAITSTSLDALRGSVATEVASKSIPAVALAT